MERQLHNIKIGAGLPTVFRNSGNMLQDSHITRDIFTFQKDFTVRGPRTRQTGRCSRSSTRQEELPHNSRPFFTPRRTPTQFEAFFTPERLPVCTRPLIHEQSACKTPHVTTDIRKIILTAKEQQHQSSSSSNCLCKHKHVAQSTSHF